MTPLIPIGLALAWLLSRGGSKTPRWPVSTYRGILSGFGVSRAEGSRKHAGADLGAFVGDRIVALDDGVVVGPVSGFAIGAGLQAVAIKHPQAEFIYAEIMVDPRLKPGVRVRRGDTVGKVAKNADGNSMLHLEAWQKAPNRFVPWVVPGPVPEGLIDVQKILTSGPWDQTVLPGV